MVIIGEQPGKWLLETRKPAPWRRFSLIDELVFDCYYSVLGATGLGRAALRQLRLLLEGLDHLGQPLDLALRHALRQPQRGHAVR